MARTRERSLRSPLLRSSVRTSDGNSRLDGQVCQVTGVRSSLATASRNTSIWTSGSETSDFIQNSFGFSSSQKEASSKDVSSSRECNPSTPESGVARRAAKSLGMLRRKTVDVSELGLPSFAEDSLELPPTQPHGPLQGIVAYVEVWSNRENRSQCFASRLRELGAIVHQSFSAKVTHVVFKEGRTVTVQKARLRNLKLVSVLWVDECYRTRSHVSEDLFPVGGPDENGSTPIVVGRLRKHRSMQPKAFEVEAALSAERLSNRQKRQVRRQELRELLACLDRPQIEASCSPSKPLRPKVLSQVQFSPGADSETPESVRNELARLRHRIAELCKSPEPHLLSPNDQTPAANSFSDIIRKRLFGMNMSSEKSLSRCSARSENLAVSFGPVLERSMSDESNVERIVVQTAVNTSVHGGTAEIRQSNSSNANWTTPQLDNRRAVLVPDTATPPWLDLGLSNELSKERMRLFSPERAVIDESDLESSKRSLCHGSGYTSDVDDDDIVQEKSTFTQAVLVPETLSPPDLPLPVHACNGKLPLETVPETPDVHLPSPEQVAPQTGVNENHNNTRRKSMRLIRRQRSPPQLKTCLSKCEWNDSEKEQKSPRRKKRKLFNPMIGQNSLAEFSTPLESDVLDEIAAPAAAAINEACKEPHSEVELRTIPERKTRFRSSLFKIRTHSVALQELLEPRSSDEFRPPRKAAIVPQRKKVDKGNHRKDACNKENRKKLARAPIQKPARRSAALQGRSLSSFSIAVTSLHRSERTFIESAVAKLGAQLDDAVTKDTSVLVCGEPRRTLNVLHALARGCWIVSFQWIVRSMELGTWAEKEMYELTDCFPTAKTSRICQEVNRNLFAQEGHIYVASNVSPPKEHLEALLDLCGGKLTISPGRAAVCVGKNDPRVLSVNEKWVLDSICAQKALPCTDYSYSATS